MVKQGSHDAAAPEATLVLAEMPSFVGCPPAFTRLADFLLRGARGTVFGCEDRCDRPSRSHRLLLYPSRRSAPSFQAVIRPAGSNMIIAKSRTPSTSSRKRSSLARRSASILIACGDVHESDHHAVDPVVGGAVGQ